MFFRESTNVTSQAICYIQLEDLMLINKLSKPLVTSAYRNISGKLNLTTSFLSYPYAII